MPSPDPWFRRELRRIDSDLRVVWGFERYFKNEWAVERRISPERYFAMYSSLLSSDEPRFVDQPIFDTCQPLYDEYGELVCYKQVGSRRFDLAPEYEWVTFAKMLDARVLTDLKRSYAWERNHSITRLRVEKEAEQQAKEAAAKAKRMDAAVEGLDEALLATRKRVQFGYGDVRDER